jgi:hypothetical protein
MSENPSTQAMSADESLAALRRFLGRAVTIETRDVAEGVRLPRPGRPTPLRLTVAKRATAQRTVKRVDVMAPKPKREFVDDVIRFGDDASAFELPLGGFVGGFWLSQSAWQSALALRGAAGEVVIATADELATPPYEYEVVRRSAKGSPSQSRETFDEPLFLNKRVKLDQQWWEVVAFEDEPNPPFAVVEPTL